MARAAYKMPFRRREIVEGDLSVRIKDPDERVDLDEIELAARPQQAGHPRRPAIEIGQPAERTDPGIDDVETLAESGLGAEQSVRVPHIAQHEARRDPRFGGEH